MNSIWETVKDRLLFSIILLLISSFISYLISKKMLKKELRSELYLDELKHKGNNTSSILLLKPHGSINWFRYMEHYSSTKDGFTGEYVSDEERMQTFLMLFSRNKRGILIHPRNMRLDMAKNWKLNLKMPCALDIIYPAKKSKVNKINYFRIYEEMQNCFKNGDEIISIGFALKKSEQEELKGLEIKKSAKITIVNKDNSIDITSRYKDVFKTSNVTFSKEKTFREYCESLKNTEIKYECGNLYKS